MLCLVHKSLNLCVLVKIAIKTKKDDNFAMHTNMLSKDNNIRKETKEKRINKSQEKEAIKNRLLNELEKDLWDDKDRKSFNIKITARRIKNLRKTPREGFPKGFSKTDLAKILRATRNTVYSWENEKAPVLPSTEALYRLSKLFKCEVAYLLGEQDCLIRDVGDIQNLTGFSEEEAKALLGYIKYKDLVAMRDILELLVKKGFLILLQDIELFITEIVAYRNKNDFANMINEKRYIHEEYGMDIAQPVIGEYNDPIPGVFVKYMDIDEYQKFFINKYSDEFSLIISKIIDSEYELSETEASRIERDLMVNYSTMTDYDEFVHSCCEIENAFNRYINERDNHSYESFIFESKEIFLKYKKYLFMKDGDLSTYRDHLEKMGANIYEREKKEL